MTMDEMLKDYLAEAGERELPEIIEEDYSDVVADIPVAPDFDLEGRFGSGVEISEAAFYNRVVEAFRKRMEKVMPLGAINACIENPVFGHMVRNKYREVMKDNDNGSLSQKRVIAGHIASLMHSLMLAFG